MNRNYVFILLNVGQLNVKCKKIFIRHEDLLKPLKSDIHDWISSVIAEWLLSYFSISADWTVNNNKFNLPPQSMASWSCTRQLQSGISKITFVHTHVLSDWGMWEEGCANVPPLLLHMPTVTANLKSKIRFYHLVNPCHVSPHSSWRSLSDWMHTNIDRKWWKNIQIIHVKSLDVHFFLTGFPRQPFPKMASALYLLFYSFPE